MNELRLTVYGNLRSKKNSKRVFCMNASRGKPKLCQGMRQAVLPSEAYIEWEANVRTQARNQIDPQAFPINEPCHVEAAIFYKGRRSDLSGALESCGDAFEGLLWTDDNLIMSWDGSRMAKDNDNPRVEICLKW